MRAAASLAVVVLALGGLTACSGSTPPPPADPVALDTIGKGDLCRQLTAGVLQELTGQEFGQPEQTRVRFGRSDGCASGSPDSGISVTVEVWAEHKGLAADILQLGSPAATTTTERTTVAGYDARTAVAAIKGRQMADLLMHVDGQVLVVLVQQYDDNAGDAPPDDQLDLATRIAERLLPD